jgi:hypothetical protein|tara:strand:+ start:719 stop:892 length:174 start_codon:yes stop_codon:yes gene_type:complete
MSFDAHLLSKYERDLRLKRDALYYIMNKETVNKKRKTYKRQSWADRKDNPKNMVNLK